MLPCPYQRDCHCARWYNSKRQTCDRAPEGAVSLSQRLPPGRTHILYLRHETARPCDSANCLCMRDPGSGLVDPTSWTLVSWLCANPGPHVEKQQGLGTKRGPRTQPVPCSWALQSSVPGARCQGLVFRTRAQLPRAYEDPTTSGKGRGRGWRHWRHNQCLINILIAAQLPWRLGLDTHIQSGKED